MFKKYIIRQKHNIHKYGYAQHVPYWKQIYIFFFMGSWLFLY